MRGLSLPQLTLKRFSSDVTTGFSSRGTALVSAVAMFTAGGGPGGAEGGGPRGVGVGPTWVDVAPNPWGWAYTVGVGMVAES